MIGNHDLDYGKRKYSMNIFGTSNFISVLLTLIIGVFRGRNSDHSRKALALLGKVWRPFRPRSRQQSVQKSVCLRNMGVLRKNNWGALNF